MRDDHIDTHDEIAASLPDHLFVMDSPWHRNIAAHAVLCAVELCAEDDLDRAEHVNQAVALVVAEQGQGHDDQRREEIAAIARRVIEHELATDWKFGYV